jgi:BED zinc finger
MDIDMNTDMAIYPSDATTESFTPPSSIPDLLTPTMSPTSAVDTSSGVDGVITSASASGRRSRSLAWLHFRKARDYRTTKKAACMHCGKTLVASHGSTSTMLLHLQRKHADIVGPITANSPNR